MRIYPAMFLLLLLALSINAEDNTWSTNGPYNARIMDIAIDPTDNNCMLLGTVENGLYFSFNSGENWEHVNSDLVPRNIRKIAFNPIHTDTVWVTTLEGCYRSINHGVDWERIYFPAGWRYEIEALAIHPLWPNIIFVSGPWFSGINYMSTDGGQNWNRMSLTQIDANNFIIDPVDDSTIYATSQAHTYRNSVYKSLDLGATWSNIHGNLDTTTAINGLAIDPINNNIIYVCGIDVTSSGNCVYKSLNGGESWANISPEGLISDWVFSIFVSPRNHNTIFICTMANGVLRSDDGGESWAEANEGLTGRQIKGISYDSLSNTYYLGTYYDGIYRSRTDGNFWEKISYNIPNTNCLDFAISTCNPVKQFVCAENGLYEFNEFDEQWEYVDILAPDYNRTPTCIAIDSHDCDNIFVGLSASYTTAAILRSQDGGLNWTAFNAGLPSRGSFNDIGIGRYQGENKLFLATANGLYKSGDAGENWQIDDAIPRDMYVTLAISQADNDYIYLGGYNGYSSTDGGETWGELDIPNVGLGYINEIAIHPYYPERIYMSILLGGIYKSIDGGESWSNITDNLPYVNNYILFSGIAINPQNPENVYVYSFDYGIFQSHDGGNTWESFNEGFDIHCGMTITLIDPSDTNRIYTATLEQSVWSIHRTPTGIDDDNQPLPSQLSLTAYPNPFNAAANISFSLPEASNVSLDIYDLLGRRTVNLLDTYLPAGNHSLLWHPEDLAAGVYIYRLTTDNNQTSHKITLLK